MPNIKKNKLVKLLIRTKNDKINNVWLSIGFMGTNVDGCLSKIIPSDSMFTPDERFPDTLTELQHFIARAMTMKRLSLIRRCDINPEILKTIEELEYSPSHIWDIFVEHRHVFDIKKKDNQEQTECSEKYKKTKEFLENWLNKKVPV